MFYLHALNRHRIGYSILLLSFVLLLTQDSLGGTVSNDKSSPASIISGIVYDQNKNPLERVDVELENAAVGGSASFRTKTDGAGRYQFANLPDGKIHSESYAF